MKGAEGGARPPRVALVLLELALSRAERDCVAGDLIEEFSLAVLPRVGESAARRWFWSQVLQSLTPLVWRRFVRGMTVQRQLALQGVGSAGGFSGSLSRGAVYRWGRALPVALVVYCMLMAVFTLSRLWSVEELPDPRLAVAPAVPVPIVRVEPAAAPAPPPAPALRHRLSLPRPMRPRLELQPPLLRPVEAAPFELAPPEILTAELDLELPEPLEPSQPWNAPLRVEGRVKAPQLIHRVEPIYGDAARRMGIHGTLVLEAVIGQGGEVASVRVLRGLADGMNEEVMRAVRQWRFKPATLDGRPVCVYFTMTVSVRTFQEGVD